MRLSRYYIPTLKENPTEAEVISHRLLVRAGMIRKLTSGLYSFLPLGLRALEKTSQIIREEMDRIGCQEIMMPLVQPADLWRETKRWDYYGKELLRINDRHNRDYCLGPTHEEVITDLVRHEIRSYRQLPVNLYQIQTKFRDEIRPRFGLMRCREFLMKDGYSFDQDLKSCQKSYEMVFEAYHRIFKRLGLKFRAVEADTGAIGGSVSHEFMVLAETGEDTIAACSQCQYAANLEKAEVIAPNLDMDPEKMKNYNQSLQSTALYSEPQIVKTPNMHTVPDVAKFLSVPAHQVIKTLLYEADNRPLAALIPGDRELNEAKLKNVTGSSELHLATPEQIESWTGAPVGFSGPKDLNISQIIADQHLLAENDWITGANQTDAHYIHIHLPRDVNVSCYNDLLIAQEGDLCPKCRGKLTFHKGIEVGHVFQLGTKYSQAMQATFLDENGREKEMLMGCYGIGVSRVVAAAIEQNHDDDGIIFSPSISPFEVLLICVNLKDQEVVQQAETVYSQLSSMDIEVMLDDRDERPGVKFKDADLLGFPIQIILGAKGLQKGIVEAKDRKTGQRHSLSLNHFESEFISWRKTIREEWGVL